jgi:hypothetical protein
MASRKEKFTFVKLILLMAAVIWLPRLLKPLAGIPDSKPAINDQSQTSPVLESTEISPNSSLAVQPISISTSTEELVGEGEFFELDRVRSAPTGLELSATLVSPAGKTAIINGRSYSEGDLISIGDLPFRLRSIFPGRAVLERDGGTFELKEKRNSSEFFPSLDETEHLK